MKDAGYFIIAVCVIVGCVIACGCSTSGPTAEAGQKVTNGGVVTDAGLRIITEDFPPFNYAGADGKAAGQATEVVNSILARLNQKAAIEILPWTEGYSLARAGPRIALYSTGRTDERENFFKWVGPIASVEYTLYARNSSGLQIYSLEAAKKAGRIGVVKDDVRHQFLQETGLKTSRPAGAMPNDPQPMAGMTTFWLGSMRMQLILPEKKASIRPRSKRFTWPKFPISRSAMIRLRASFTGRVL
jgi:polar amino acid transport system substrate-binding protein